jgi:peptidoglycan/xylan/chitin deacetylase (PgdA/CDA1 family)
MQPSERRAGRAALAWSHDAMSIDIRKLVKTGIGQFLTLSGLHRSKIDSKVIITAFHRVNDHLPPDSLTCRSEMFEQFCRYFKDNFRVVPLAEQIEGFKTGRNMGGTLSITFDDGYLDNYEVAAPILEKLGLPATFFITSDFIASERVPFWDKELPQQPGWMNWEQVRDLAKRGFTIGGHTVNHIDMGKEPAERVRQELDTSKSRIESELGRGIELFAYPFGGEKNINETSRQLVREAGFNCCMSCHGGTNEPATDVYRLKRIPISTWFSTPQQLTAELVMGSIRS